jgi:hypothetical protein
MTQRLSELAAPLLVFLVIAALIYGTTGLIDEANNQPILISHHEES